ncbi:hypothetical protein BGX27_002048 [Mortierella sp. AM989]|nr:hypothetical protein BGX27_002048 [Mortierella sp. AM989]
MVDGDKRGAESTKRKGKDRRLDIEGSAPRKPGGKKIDIIARDTINERDWLCIECMKEWDETSTKFLRENGVLLFKELHLIASHRLREANSVIYKDNARFFSIYSGAVVREENNNDDEEVQEVSNANEVQHPATTTTITENLSGVQSSNKGKGRVAEPSPTNKRIRTLPSNTSITPPSQRAQPISNAPIPFAHFAGMKDRHLEQQVEEMRARLQVQMDRRSQLAKNTRSMYDRYVKHWSPWCWRKGYPDDNVRSGRFLLYMTENLAEKAVITESAATCILPLRVNTKRLTNDMSGIDINDTWHDVRNYNPDAPRPKPETVDAYIKASYDYYQRQISDPTNNAMKGEPHPRTPEVQTLMSNYKRMMNEKKKAVSSKIRMIEQGQEKVDFQQPVESQPFLVLVASRYYRDATLC